MNLEKYLPIGTVVLLKGAKKRIMITGFCSSDKSSPSKIFDYSGCLYPEGTISSDKILLFNHEQIEKVYFIGLIDEEEKKFKANLKKFLEKYNQNND